MSSRLAAIDPAAATGEAKAMLDAVKAKLGMAPNMMRAMANAPAVLKGYLDFSAALAGGTLGAKVREQIALAVAEANRCDYCLSAHTAIGRMAGLKADELLDSRRGQAADPKAAAALRFARAAVAGRGNVADAHVADLRAAGYGDGEIAEVVANVALNLFTNYFNHVARTDVDFPAAPALG